MRYEDCGLRSKLILQVARDQHVLEDYSIEAYRAFLKRKCEVSIDSGFAVLPDEVHPFCKPHQRDGIIWCVRGGRRALFEAFGLGKTVQQLEILRLILKKLDEQDAERAKNGVLAEPGPCG